MYLPALFLCGKHTNHSDGLASDDDDESADRAGTRFVDSAVGVVGMFSRSVDCWRWFGVVVWCDGLASQSAFA